MKKIILFFVIFLSLINFTFAKEIPFSEIWPWEIIVLSWSVDNESFDSENTNISLPLKHTEVESNISWFIAKTTITQTFENNYNTPIEAIYNFPLSNNASVDSMIMMIWDRKIIWKIEKKQKAKELYEKAKQDWKTASLLNQQRPNIFTQNIANINPKEQIKIIITTFETISYDNWNYNYTFPLVVWPRFIPENTPDSQNLTSPTISAGTRNWHDVNITVNLDAWINIKQLKSNSHDVNIKKISEKEAQITLKNKWEIPNKDFSITYQIADKKPQTWMIFYRKNKENIEPSQKQEVWERKIFEKWAYKDVSDWATNFSDEKILEFSEGWYFTLMIEPQNEITKTDIRNKEIVFVLDTSWSMAWKPIESVKKAMNKAINDLWDNDYINIYSFNNWVTKLFEDSQKSTKETKEKALEFTSALQAGGGTVMDEPFKEALKDDWNYEDRMRIVLIMTDWDIWNEKDILKIVKKDLWKNRVFALWVDAAPNRYLLDNISLAWKWKTTYILWDDNIDKKIEEFYKTFSSPILTDLKIDFSSINAFDIVPKEIPDLYFGQPIKITWKYKWTIFWDISGEKEIKISWKNGNNEYLETIKINVPKSDEKNSSLPSYWARQKIDQIYSENLFEKNKNLEEEITALGLNYSIMSEFTSFIAIDENSKATSNESKTIVVPTYEVEWKDYSMQKSANYNMSNTFWANNSNVKYNSANIDIATSNESIFSAPKVKNEVYDNINYLKVFWIVWIIIFFVIGFVVFFRKKKKQ